MKVIKVEIEGLVTSFRYPHILVGRQPSYPAPPPSTIYGHLASALGDFFAPDGVRFACCFDTAGSGDDLETTWFTSVSTGKIDRKWGHVKNIEAQSNVLKRELLLHPRMTLYISVERDLERWLRCLREPAYPVILGRSQDLCAYRSVEEVELESSEDAYLDPGLLPWDLRAHLPAGISCQMPQYVDPNDRRRVRWARYVVLDERVWWGKASSAPRGAPQALRRQGSPPLMVDPTTPEWSGARRAVVFQPWTQI